MIEFPPTLDLSVLQSEHPDYTEMLPVWQKIDLLASGGHKLERAIASFIPKRFGEPPEIYKERIKKFTYRNILGDCLRHQVARVANGFVNVTASDEAFWEEFRSNTDGKNRTEKKLISKLLSTLMRFKVAFLQVDRPAAGFVPRNQAENELVGSPYIVVRSPLEVVNWSESEQLDWVKLYSLSVDTSNAFAEKPVHVATWTFIDDASIAIYSAAVELGKDGKITSVLGNDGKRTKIVPLVSLVEHGLGRLPIAKIELDDDLWAGDQASAKAYEHLRLDCHKFDLLTFAYFQRHYKRPVRADSNLPPDYADTFIGDGSEQPMVGLEYVPELESFQFAEPNGAIVEHINSTLERIEVEIEQLLDLTGASTEPGRVNQQSGYAREFDFISQRETLKNYGSVVIDALQRSYELVQQYQGRSPDVVVSGLDRFDIDDVSSLLAHMTSITMIDFATLQRKLPPVLFFSLYERLCFVLQANLSPEQITALKGEVEAMSFEAIAPEVAEEESE